MRKLLVMFAVMFLASWQTMMAAMIISLPMQLIARKWKRPFSKRSSW